jgi:methyl-accepting chemotaxis protein
MSVIRNLSVKAKLSLLVGCFVIGFISLSLFSFGTLDQVKVNGPYYRQIVAGKDLIADILPPPEYIIESYLVVSELNDETDQAKQEALVNKGKKLREEYEQRHEFWVRELEAGELKEIMVTTSYRPAVEFYEARDREFIPAILAGDKRKAQRIFETVLRPKYEVHRAAIDQVVVLANQRNAEVEQAAASVIQARTRWQTAFSVSIVLLVALSGWVIAASIYRPLSETIRVVEAVTTGDLEHQVEYQSKDEIGKLASAFREMMGYFREVAQAVSLIGAGNLTAHVAPRSESDTLSLSLGRTISSLRESIRQIADTAMTLSAASEELSATSSQMSAAAEETSAQSSVVSTSTRQVSASVQIAASSAEEMHAATREISRSAGEAAQIACAGVKVAAATNQTITRLGENSAEIGQVIKLINSIAEQTNLLALNATIEAARAGEAGKGFAVVASEVRELARETGKATSEISHRITAIQTSAQAAVAAIGEISGIINQISEIQNTVASAVEQQTATTNEISRNVMAAAQGSVEITDNLSGVAQAVQSASIGAAETQRAAAELSRMAADLRHLLSRFRYEQVQSEFDSVSADPHFRISGRPSDEQNKVKSVGASA